MFAPEAVAELKEEIVAVITTTTVVHLPSDINAHKVVGNNASGVAVVEGGDAASAILLPVP